MEIKNVQSISEIIEYISNITINDNNIQLAFRGESKDYRDNALTPFIYRKNYKKEDFIYREMQRFNDNEFKDDRTTFDKLSRMQHHSAPTRLLDITEDLMSAIYFSIKNKNYTEDSILYIFEIEKEKIKYYDSDAVSVVSNIVKLPLKGSNNKSKKKLFKDTKEYLKHKKQANNTKSFKFLRHEIREEKPQFEPIINPKDIFSVQCVRPKLTNARLKSQKGFFLLFGLNPDSIKKPIRLIDIIETRDSRIRQPIRKIHKLSLRAYSIKKMQEDLEKMGITEAFIYPEMDNVAKYFTNL